MELLLDLRDTVRTPPADRAHVEFPVLFGLQARARAAGYAGDRGHGIEAGDRQAGGNGRTDREELGTRIRRGALVERGDPADAGLRTVDREREP